jgi:hypothetical protein
VCGSHSLLGEEGFFLLLLLEIPRKPFGKSSDDPGLSLSLSAGEGKMTATLNSPARLFDTHRERKKNKTKQKVSSSFQKIFKGRKKKYDANSSRPPPSTTKFRLFFFSSSWLISLHMDYDSLFGLLPVVFLFLVFYSG